MSVMSPSEAASQADEGYACFEDFVRQRVALAEGPLFETTADKDALWQAYLGGIPEARRQHYNCHCCRRFIQTFGGLVTVKDDGRTLPVLWRDATHNCPAFFFQSVLNLYGIVAEAQVAGVFLYGGDTWGFPKTGTWTHLSGVPRPSLIAKGTKLKTLGQIEAERKEDFGIVQRSISDFPLHVVEQAVAVLESESVPQGEVAVGQAKWFRSLLTSLPLDSRKRSNLVWRAVATAPTGYAHFRSGMLSTLLADLIEGLPFHEVKKRWSDKMHPLRYMRPQAAPTEGQIDAAEKVVEKLGVAASFPRRFAKLEEVLHKLWVPRRPDTPAAQTASGVFAHLRKQAQASPADKVTLPQHKITWEKFARTVLPGALEVYFKVPSHLDQFYGLTTAVNPDAPPIFQWDGLEGFPRNPLSWYVYNNGSSATQWGLSHHSWAKVTAVFLAPFAWHRPELFRQHTDRVMFALEGAKDTRSKGAGLALFPSLLKNDLHSVRSVIEAYSNRGSIADPEEGTANGYMFVKGSSKTPKFYVIAGASASEYEIDRWD